MHFKTWVHPDQADIAKMNTLDFKKAKVKQIENCHSIQKKPAVVFHCQFPSLRHYPVEEFTSLWIVDVEGLFWLWVGTKSEQLICFGKALDTRAIGSVSLCHFS